MRGPEFKKRLSVVVAVIGTLAASFSLLSVENPIFEHILNDRRQILVLTSAAIGLSGSIFAAFLVTQGLRRSRLRRRARRVFIIYAREDQKEAKKLAEALRVSGVEPWLDTDEISAGEVWKDAVSKALSESAMAIVLLTEHASSSDFVKYELRSAIQNMEANDKITSPIIPVLYSGGVIPSSLQHIQYVDMSQPDAVEFLVRSVYRAMDRVLASHETRESE